MSPRTGQWVERGLLSPACGPRLGQSLSGGGGCLCHLRARAAMPLRGAHQAWALARSPMGGGSPFVASFPSPRCWGLVVGLARGVRAGP